LQKTTPWPFCLTSVNNLYITTDITIIFMQKIQITPERILDLCNAHCVSEVFFEACEKNLFSIMDSKVVHSQWIFDKIGVLSLPGGYFLNALQSMGLLEKNGEEYCNTPFSKEYLVESSSSCMLSFIRQSSFQRRYWGTLGKAMASGMPTAFDAKIPSAGEAESRNFIKAMEEKAALTAKSLVQELRPYIGSRVLDVGCGSGCLLREIHHQTAKGGENDVVLHGYDIERSISVAKDLLPAGVPVSFFEGNFLDGELTVEKYSLAILSNIVHMYSPEDNVNLMKKIWDALNPGGFLAVFDLFFDGTNIDNLQKNIFSLNMVMGSFGGRVYALSEMVQHAASSGFIEKSVVNIGFLGTLIIFKRSERRN